ncbi:MAG: LamG domain-containing protein, partial [Bdellovibrionota bacterium]|nr:LamG domain-containing protein [Bdellovibrionota bacterium]
INDENGSDKDADGEVINYTCQFSRTEEAVTAFTANPCSKASGLNFGSLTGLMKWKPALDSAGTWYFKITGTDGKDSDNIFFSIEVNDINLSPELTKVKSATIDSGTSLKIDVNDKHTKEDKDRDGETVVYSCFFDSVIDGLVSEFNSCKSDELAGVSFDKNKGLFEWNAPLKTFGKYEFRVRGQDSSLGAFDDVLFTVTVNDKMKPEKVILEPESKTFSEDFEVTIKGGKDSNFKEFRYVLNGAPPVDCSKGIVLGTGNKISIKAPGKKTISIIACDKAGNASASTIETYQYAFKDDSLFAHYKFDESAGSSVNDSTGKAGRKGVLNDSTKWFKDNVRGHVLAFDGTSVQFKENDRNNFLTQEFQARTISMWVKPKEIHNKDSFQMVYDEGGDVKGISLVIQNGQFIAGVYNYSKSSTKVDDKVSWSFESDGVNKWYHVAITFDGNEKKLKLFINGKLKDEKTTSINIVEHHPGERGLGQIFGETAMGTKGSSYKGLIDDLRFYSKALADSKINSLFNESTGGVPIAPKALGEIEPTHIRPNVLSV